MPLHIPERFAAPGLAIPALAAVLVAAVWALTFERIGYERGEEVREAQAANAATALAFEEHTARALLAAEQALLLAKHEYDLKGALVGVVLLDARGKVVLSRGDALVPAREDFRAHRDQDGQPRIGQTASTPAGRPGFTLSRRLAAPDGGFAGVAAATLSAGALAAFGDELELGAATEVDLIGLDGAVRARRAAEERMRTDDPADRAVLHAAGVARHGSLVSAEEVPRYVSYRVFADYPLVVTVATSVQRTLLAFHARERVYRRNAAIATLAILAFALGLFVVWLRWSERDERFAELARNIPEAFWIFDTVGSRALYLSPAFGAIAGRDQRSPARAWREWQASIHPEDRERATRAYAGLVRGELDVEHRVVRPDGEVRWIRARGFPVREATGELYRVVGTFADETERRRAQEQLLHQAQYDGLTNLPNRIMCFDRIEQAIGHAQRHKCSAAVLFLDLDRFKAINDTLGHATGDALLREAAGRLTGCVGAGDTVARLGSDQFALILGELARPLDARATAQKALAALAAPARVGEREVFVTASIGIATYPPDGRDPDTLLRNADAAMLRAKEAGGNTCSFYTAAMNRRAMENLLLETDLRRALERAEFRLYFQPKQHIASGATSGFEALLRWQHPDKGLLEPAHFVPLLEDSGLIVQVGDWIVRAACAQLRDWQRAGLEPRPVAVNLVVKQFLQQDIAAVIEAALRDTGVAATLLQVEVTESAAMERPEEVVPVLRRLKARGIRIAIDDFGTGYSSLAYLKSLPLDTLKLDRSFVKGLPTDPGDASISRAVIAMAHSLGLKVIAEGVQTRAQRDFLASLGCDELQGYLFSRPLPAAECERLLDASALVAT